MEPNEQAIKLVDEFQNIVIDTYSNQLDKAIKSARLCVQKILGTMTIETRIADRKYWEEVLEILEGMAKLLKAE